MAHHTSVVPGMKDPSTRFRRSVSRVEDAANETKSNVSTFSPRHNTEEKSVNVSGTISRMVSVDYFDTGLIVFVDRCWRRHGEG